MRALVTLWLVIVASVPAFGAERAPNGEQMLANYFRNETALLADRCLADIRTPADWETNRAEYRRQLQEMLGLWPLPEKTELQPVITGKLEEADFVVEKLYFQASPHLYVTANLYLPKKIDKPAPTILYACGHSTMVTNGVSCGNKTHYQQHGAWFARNGYVCLLIDTLQLGEIQGLHHGTSRLGQWWWNSRGYTPAGVEAWFGIRALDYLCTRPEVDKDRIGMTGRSGGGSYTWTVAALDDRVKVAAPVAGITDLENHVVDGCVEGHCDCMFYLNSYRWDFAQCAALIAPRPLLIGNSDKDRIFPLDGVMRIHNQVRRLYRLLDATNNLSVLITDGPHADTQELQVPVFRWFNRFLKNDQAPVEMVAKQFFNPMQLRVFDKLPADAVNTNIQSLFVPRAKPAPTETAAEKEALLTTLKQKTFGGWPAEDLPLEAKRVMAGEWGGADGVKFSAWDFTSQHDVRLRLYVIERAGPKPTAGPVMLNVMDEAGWKNWRNGVAGRLMDNLEQTGNLAMDGKDLDELKQLLANQPANPASALAAPTPAYAAQAFVAPRGVGPTAWGGNEKTRGSIRRRFMLLGQTLDGMRVWDIRRAVQMIHYVREADAAKVDVSASGAMAVNAKFAVLFEPGARSLMTKDMMLSGAAEPDYIGIQRYVDVKSLETLKPGAH